MVKNFCKNLFTFSDGIYRTKQEIEISLVYQNKKIKIAVEDNFGWNGVTGFKTTLKTLIPSMVHDFIIFDERINGNKRFTREDMDKIFIILCKMYKVPSWKIVLFRTALCINRKILMG